MPLNHSSKTDHPCREQFLEGCDYITFFKHKGFYCESEAFHFKRIIYFYPEMFSKRMLFVIKETKVYAEKCLLYSRV